MKYDAEVSRAIAHWAPVYGVKIDPALVHAIIQQESRHGALGMVTAESKGRKSYGPMMVLDSTARELGAADPAALKDPAAGIWYGVKQLAKLLQHYHGNATMAVHAYNGWGKGPVNDTPNQYVNAVSVFWNQYKKNAVVAVPATALLVLLGLMALSARRRAA